MLVIAISFQKNADHLRRVIRASEGSGSNGLFLYVEVEDPKRFVIVRMRLSKTGS